MVRSKLRSNDDSQTVAVCDLGTYSGLILIARRVHSRLIAIREERHTVDLLSESGRSRRLTPTALRRATEVVSRFRNLAEQYVAGRAAVVCTAAVRDAPNGELFAQSLRNIARCPVRVLSARQEAVLSAGGALTGTAGGPGAVTVVDIGGGSTEIIVRFGSRHRFRFLKCGAARASANWSGAARIAASDRASFYSRKADAIMREVPAAWGGLRGIVGVGGTIVTLAAIHARLRRFDESRLHGETLTTGWIAGMAERLTVMNRSAIARLIPFDPDRARVLTAGTFLWVGVLNRLGADRVMVSVRGLRWGVAARLAEASRL